MELIRKLLKYDPFSKLSIQQWLLWSSVFSCLLLLVRVCATGSLTYLFLPWNLFLAFVPYAISAWLRDNILLQENRIKFVLILLAWLLFIPNSFYIITDLYHLTHIDSAPEWFDVLMLFSFAWNGLVLGVISVRRIEYIISLQTGKAFSMLFVFLVMWLSALGIYIGRFLRFNSWDIITDPFSLAVGIIDLLVHPFKNGAAWGMTLAYCVFMIFLYTGFKKIAESFSKTA